MPKYLVTGGAGFIGSHVVAALIERGDPVRIIDNLSTGKKENLHPKAEFINADIRQLEEIKPLFTGFDGVFHLAALPRVQVSIVNPTETNDINITGTLNVLLAARDAGVFSVVFGLRRSCHTSIAGRNETESEKPVRTSKVRRRGICKTGKSILEY